MSRDAARETEEQQAVPALAHGMGLLRAVALSALVTALLMGLVVIIRILAPAGAWTYLPAAIFLIALEAVLTTRWLEHPDRRQLNRAVYRLSEVMVIAVLLRLLTWGLTGGLPGPELLRRYFLSPLSMLDGAFAGYLLCGIVAWERGVRFAGLFLRLDISYSERNFYSLPLSEQRKRYSDRPIERQRPHAFSELVKSWLNGGLLLALSTALSTIDLPAVDTSEGIRSIARLGLRPEMLGALIVYFVLGLWLISQGRLAMMRARWLADSVASPGDLAASWRRTSLILLVVIAFAAAFLPIGSTLGAAVVLQALLAVVLAIGRFAFLLFSIPLFLLLSLLGVQDMPEGQPQAAPEVVTPMPGQDGRQFDETTALIAGGAFWILVAFVAVAALIFFLRDRGYVPSVKRSGQWWERLIGWLRGLLKGASARASTLQKAVGRRLPSSLKGTETPGRLWPSLRLNSLPPRSQIRYLYLSAVRRAAEKGVPREESETPSEYAHDLKQKWPEAQEEIEGLTGAFLQARYSSHEIEAEEVGPARRWWKRIRRVLRRSRRGGPAQRADD